MGNPAIVTGLPEKTPCTTCRHCAQIVTGHLGQPHADCKQPYINRLFVGVQDGCRWWEARPTGSA